MVGVGMQVKLGGVVPVLIVIVFHPLAAGQGVDVLGAHPGNRQNADNEK